MKVDKDEYDWFIKGIVKYKNNLKCKQKNILTHKSIQVKYFLMCKKDIYKNSVRN